MKIKGLNDTIEWYNNNAKAYSNNVAGKVDLKAMEKFISLLKKRDKVMDAGCAAGRDSKYLLDKGFSVIGLDLSSSLLEIARSNYPEINFVEGSFSNLPFESNSFNGIWSSASILHLETVDDVLKALNEFSRVLIKDGILMLKVKAKTTSDKTAVVNDSLSKHDRFFQYFEKNELENYLEDLNFELISTDQFTGKGRTDIDWIVILARKN